MKTLRIMWAEWRLRRVERSVLRNRWDHAVTALADHNRLARARARVSKAKYP